MTLKASGQSEGERKRKRRIAISGLFLTRPITGMERYATEVVAAIDHLIDSSNEECFLVVPRRRARLDLVRFRNIELIEFGFAGSSNLSGYLWEQFFMPLFLLTRRARGLFLLNFAPAALSDLVLVIHDGNAFTHPEFYRGVSKKLYRFLATTLLTVARRRARRIVTVSDSSRRELIEKCGFDDVRISVATPGLEHIGMATAPIRAASVPESFYFALSSATANKNFEWVLRAAILFPTETFLIAGTGSFEAVLFSAGLEKLPDNVQHLGYISDELRDLLFVRCEAFLFPSRYEGFGMPPLEAAVLGARVIVSDIPSMREIFGNEFLYIQPDEWPNSLREVVNTVDPQQLRERFSWVRSAGTILGLLRS